MPDVVRGCLEACRRCQEVVAAVIAQDPAAFPLIGPHLRHCVEHFELLLDRWRDGVVDYDARPRDPRLESDPAAFRIALARIAQGLAGLRRDDLERSVTVAQSVAPGSEPVVSPSRLDRELAFLSSHTIHHIALMALTGRSVGVEIPAELGVAYSTDRHRAALAMKL